MVRKEGIQGNSHEDAPCAGNNDPMVHEWLEVAAIKGPASGRIIRQFKCERCGDQINEREIPEEYWDEDEDNEDED